MADASWAAFGCRPLGNQSPRNVSHWSSSSAATKRQGVDGDILKVESKVSMLEPTSSMLPVSPAQ
eukprot:6131241-Amphidinium_carterae.1